MSAVIPAFKCSTFRGGIGDALLKVHCISDGDCKKCVFRESCVVHGIYYHPLKIIPDAVKDGGSLGYTFECLDRRTYINAGDLLSLHQKRTAEAIQTMWFVYERKSLAAPSRCFLI